MDLTYRLKSILEETFYLDLRSLRLFRYLLGFAIVVCAASFLIFSKAFLLEDGVVPSQYLPKSNTYFSLFSLFDWYYWPIALVLLMLLSAMLFAFGYFTRINAFILFLITLSLENRYIITGGTVGIRLGLVWAVFIPLSKNNLENSNSFKRNEFRYFSLPTTCLFLKVCIFYWAAFFNKDFNDWGVRNTGVYHSLWLGGFATKLGQILREHENLTIWITRFVYPLEFLAPVLLLVSAKNGLFRGIACLALFFFHVGIILVFKLEEFPYANIAIVSALVPFGIWERFNKNSNSKIIIGNYKTYHIIPVCLLLLLLCKNLHNFNIINPLPNMSNTVLSSIRMQEKWDMFRGGGSSTAYWIMVRARTTDGHFFDLWRWYLNLQDINYVRQRPPNLSELAPTLRWCKYIYNIIVYRQWNRGIQDAFLSFLCRTYNTSKDKPFGLVESATLMYGEQTLKGLNNILVPSIQDLTQIRCPLPN